jgi:Flp pilus assembly protein TadD
MPHKPDFVVDPSGNVRDVRGQDYAQQSQSSSQRPEPGSSRPGKDAHAGSTPRTPGGIIIIPIGLIITLVIAVLRMCSGPAQKNSYSESDVNLLNSGLSSYDQGDYEKALIYFNMVIASQPDMGEAYNDRGLAYYGMGDTDNAMADFNKAIELLPNPAVSYSNRGGLYLFQGNHEQALADLDKAIGLSPRLAKAYYNRALTYLDLSNYDQSIADFDQAIELTPEYFFSMQATIESRQPTGPSLLGSGLYTGALDRETYADLPTAYASRAIAYFHKGDYAQAAADLQKATELSVDPGLALQVWALLAVSTWETQPVSTLVPQTGHWEGNSNPVGVQGTVSFDIGADGQIHDFKLGLMFAGGSSCQVASYDVLVQPDGTFSFTFDTPGIEGGILTQGKFESSTVVAGSFSGYIECITSTGEHINGGQSQGDSWSAQWVSGPDETPVSSKDQASAFPSDFLDAYGVVMINVPAGTFTMGNNDAASSAERPAHSVYLAAYAIDKYEVTNRLYKACVDAGVCHGGCPRMAVEAGLPRED